MYAGLELAKCFKSVAVGYQQIDIKIYTIQQPRTNGCWFVGIDMVEHNGHI